MIPLGDTHVSPRWNTKVSGNLHDVTPELAILLSNSRTAVLMVNYTELYKTMPTSIELGYFKHIPMTL